MSAHVRATGGSCPITKEAEAEAVFKNLQTTTIVKVRRTYFPKVGLIITIQRPNGTDKAKIKVLVSYLEVFRQGRKKHVA